MAQFDQEAFQLKYMQTGTTPITGVDTPPVPRPLMRGADWEIVITARSKTAAKPPEIWVSVEPFGPYDAAGNSLLKVSIPDLKNDMVQFNDIGRTQLLFSETLGVIIETLPGSGSTDVTVACVIDVVFYADAARKTELLRISRAHPFVFTL